MANYEFDEEGASEVRARPVKVLPPHLLMMKPALTFHEVCFLLDLPSSTMTLETKDVPMKWFRLGRRRYVRREDFLQWLGLLAERKPALEDEEDEPPAQRRAG